MFGRSKTASLAYIGLDDEHYKSKIAKFSCSISEKAKIKYITSPNYIERIVMNKHQSNHKEDSNGQEEQKEVYERLESLRTDSEFKLSDVFKSSPASLSRNSGLNEQTDSPSDFTGSPSFLSQSKWNKLDIQGVNFPAIQICEHLVKPYLRLVGICVVCGKNCSNKNSMQCRSCRKVVHSSCLNEFGLQYSKCSFQIDTPFPPSPLLGSPFKFSESKISTNTPSQDLLDLSRGPKQFVLDEKKDFENHKLEFVGRKASRDAICGVCNIKLYNTHNRFYKCKNCGEVYHLKCIAHAAARNCKSNQLNKEQLASMRVRMTCFKAGGKENIKIALSKFYDPDVEKRTPSKIPMSVNIGLASPQDQSYINVQLKFHKILFKCDFSMTRNEYEFHKEVGNLSLNDSNSNYRLVFEVCEMVKVGIFKRSQVLSSRCFSFSQLSLKKPLIEGNFILRDAPNGLVLDASCAEFDSIKESKKDYYWTGEIMEDLIEYKSDPLNKMLQVKEESLIGSISTKPFSKELFAIEQEITKKFEIDISMFKEFKMIGKGSYGTAWACVYSPSGRIKVVKELAKPANVHKEDTANLVAESSINKLLADNIHPFILKTSAAFQNEESCFFMMEKMICNMSTYLKLEKRFEEKQMCVYLLQIAYALNHLHSLYIIYRDLKIDNLLMDDCGRIKLCDFGVSKILTPNQGRNTFSCTGTPLFMAPECFDYSGYDFRCDWYSFGVVAFIMRTNRYLFHISNQNSFVLELRRKSPDFSRGHFSTHLQNLLENTLKKSPRIRFGFDQVSSHKFFKDQTNIPLEKLVMPFSKDKLLDNCADDNSSKTFANYEDKNQDQNQYLLNYKDCDLSTSSDSFQEYQGQRNYLENFDYFFEDSL